MIIKIRVLVTVALLGVITGCSSQTSNQKNRITCESAPQEYLVQAGDSSANFGFVGNYSLDFKPNSQLLISGWTRTEIQQVLLNPTNRQLQSYLTSTGPITITACEGRCSAVVLDMSPDKQWLLALDKDDNLWLSNRERTYIELIATRPLTWRWSKKGQWLWVEEPAEGFGKRTIQIGLQIPIARYRSLLFIGKPLNRQLADFHLLMVLSSQ
ncbi:MAG: hypothetical protein HC853_04400 [Anaerolineae bacterium]|nr:hypothetical protein [Anaerolineae bacterium]